MWSHLLIHIIQEGGKEVPYFGEPDGAGWLGEALLYALLGFFVTFLGIVLLIFIVWLCGQIVSRLSARKGSKKAAAPAAPAATAEEEGIGEEVRAAIIAAIAAHYADEEGTCEFKVKRIKRL